MSKSAISDTQRSPFDGPLDDNLKVTDVGKELSEGEVSDKLPFKENPLFTRAPFILANELCERLAYYGIATNIVTYMIDQLGLPTSYALSMQQLWSGTCYLTPLLGSYLADASWGRYRVILVFSIIYFFGMSLLAISAGVSPLKPAGAPVEADGLQKGVFWTAMYLVALGTGGIKPCVSTFGADQFDESDPRQARLVPSFFNYFYACINIGALVASTVLVNIQVNVSWALGFLIPAVCFAGAILLFLCGSKLYRRLPPSGSPYKRVFGVLFGACAHKGAVIEPDGKNLNEVEGDMSIVPNLAKMDHTPGLNFLDRAAVPVKGPGVEDKWLRTVTEVEEVKSMARLLPIFLTLIMYNAIYAQMSSLFVVQGNGMDLRMGEGEIAAATLSMLDCISVIFWVVVYDRVIAPLFVKWGRPISILKRIGAGYVVAVLSMVAAALVEEARLKAVADNNLQDVNPATASRDQMVPISVWYQTPQYVLIGLSEVLAMVGSYEYFYSQAPDSMRSTSMALQLLATCFGSYTASVLNIIVGAITGGSWVPENINQGHMNYYFWMLAVLMAIDFVIFIFLAKKYRYKTVHEETLNVEALAMGAQTMSGLNYSQTFSNTLSRQASQGLVRRNTLDRQRSMGLEGGQMSFAKSKSLMPVPGTLPASGPAPPTKAMAKSDTLFHDAPEA